MSRTRTGLIGMAVLAFVVAFLEFCWTSKDSSNKSMFTGVVDGENSTGISRTSYTPDGNLEELSETARNILYNILVHSNVSKNMSISKVLHLLERPSVPAVPAVPYKLYWEVLSAFYNTKSPLELKRAITKALETFQTNVDGVRIPAETSLSNCFMQLVAAAVYAGQHGRAVEYGTFMGFSTRCIAAGLHIGTLVGKPTHKFYAFDTFEYIDEEHFVQAGWQKKNINALRKPESYMEQVQRNVYPYDVQLFRGFIGRGNFGSGSYWGSGKINYVSVDSSKDEVFFRTQMKLILPWLDVGTMIVLGDSLMKNAVCGQIGITLGALVYPGYVRLVLASPSSAHTFWEVLKPVPASLVQRFRYESLDKAVWNQLWDTMALQVSESYDIVWGKDHRKVRGKHSRIPKMKKQCM